MWALARGDGAGTHLPILLNESTIDIIAGARAVEALKERIRREGKNLGNGILKVDSFINHQVDPALMLAVGGALAAHFGALGITKVLTAEISGIAPALTTALALGVPVVYARKTKPITMPQSVFLEVAPSHTKGK